MSGAFDLLWDAAVYAGMVAAVVGIVRWVRRKVRRR